MEFEQGPSYAIYTMLGSFYTPGKTWKPLKSMKIPPKIKPFGQCRSGQFFEFSWKLFLLHHPPMDFTIQKHFPNYWMTNMQVLQEKNTNGATVNCEETAKS